MHHSAIHAGPSETLSLSHYYISALYLSKHHCCATLQANTNCKQQAVHLARIRGIYPEKKIRGAMEESPLCNTVGSFPSASVPGVRYRGEMCMPLISRSLTDKTHYSHSHITAHITSASSKSTGSHSAAVDKEVGSLSLILLKHQVWLKGAMLSRKRCGWRKKPHPFWLFQRKIPFFFMLSYENKVFVN